LSRLIQYFHIIDLQAKMALRADASRYMLGYIWWILEPLLFVAVFYLVFGIILNTGRADFLIFLICGKLPFVWLSKTVNQAANSIVKNKGMIGRIHVPKVLFPMATVQESLYKQAAVFALLFGILLFDGYPVTSTYLWLGPLVLVNYLFIVVCSLGSAYIVCLIRDFAMVVPLAMTFLMFASGIFWDVRDLGDPAKTELILAVNPVAFILDAYRQILMEQTPPDALHLGIMGGILAILTLVLFWLMHRSSQYLALKALSS
jgi:lipopolysaccharide transport system permease protein